MTAPSLLFYICLALTVQLALGGGWTLWRRSRKEVPTPTSNPVAARPAGAWEGWRPFRVVRRECEDLQQTQTSFYLEPLDGIALAPFKPGQFLTFQLPASANRSVTRCYSLSDQPHSKCYRITVKRAIAPEHLPDAQPGISSNYLHDSVQVGDVLQVKAPSGHFHLENDTEVPVVLVGGGIGITPMMSMLQWILQNQPRRNVHLFYGVRNGAVHAFKSELERLAIAHQNFLLHVVYSRPAALDVPGQDYSHTGHIDVSLLKQILPHGRHQFYVCGSAPLMESLVPELVIWGVQRTDLHFEAFGPSSVCVPGDTAQVLPQFGATPVMVRFSESGRTVQWDGTDSNLLDFAERHGVAVESGCRSGGCGCCESPVKEGVVHYVNPPDHDPAPGHCLLCVGRPASSNLVLCV